MAWLPVRAILNRADALAAATAWFEVAARHKLRFDPALLDRLAAARGTREYLRAWKALRFTVHGIPPRGLDSYAFERGAHPDPYKGAGEFFSAYDRAYRYF